jgi:iron complex outermembrane receptor protein
MKKVRTHGGLQPLPQRSFLQATPVAAACVALLWATGGAQAQQAQAGASSGSVVTVTGIRKGIEDAISVKRSADTIVEAISAEDIGKLPDASVAESISRLPGVATQRSSVTGKAQEISVRGMSPDFNGGLLNGREVASSGDSRGVDFDLYPGGTAVSVLVYKTPHAGLVGQGLSSTIDLRTVQAADSPSARWRQLPRPEDRHLQRRAQRRRLRRQVFAGLHRPVRQPHRWAWRWAM